MNSQIVCVQCFHQNDSIAGSVSNYILNGGFENTTCVSNVFSSSFCPASTYYSCTVANWTCTGGGSSSYASIDDNTFTMTADGSRAAYFGNGSNASACSSLFNDTSCLSSSSCVLTGIPAGYPTNDTSYGSTTGVSMEQTVSGLMVGSTYVLEFWAGGEPQTHGWTKDGVFAVDLGFGKTFLRCKPTEVVSATIGTRFLIIFNATSTTHTVKFTNWGHICIPCTELILDNVRLYSYQQLPEAFHCVITNGIAEAGEQPAITVSPNPGSGIFTFAGLNNDDKITVINVTGGRVLDFSVQNKNAVTIDLTAFAKGLYFYKIVGKQGEVSEGKIIKE